MRIFLFFLLFVLAACQPAVDSVLTAPAVVAFPTTTPGQVIRGGLPTVVALSLDGNLANPATAVALANQPTVTPDYTLCPQPTEALLALPPTTARAMAESITDYLSLGGRIEPLINGLRDDWGVLGESGAVLPVAVTGAQETDLLVTYGIADSGGVLALMGCANGRYVLHHYVETTAIPQVIHISDMNLDGSVELLYTVPECAANAQECTYRTQLLSWQAGRLSGVLDGIITSQSVPEILDVDSDFIQEIVVRMTSTGTAATGPLRTGVMIYDWNGSLYTRSITQLDPPAFRIQVLQQADRNLNRGETAAAITLYEQTLNNTDLRNWFNDDVTVLHSYTLFRLLTAYAYTEDERLLPTFQTIQETYPDLSSAPVFVPLSNAFWNALQVTGNLRSACLEVQDMARQDASILGLLNRYGQQTTVMTPSELCPF